MSMIVARMQKMKAGNLTGIGNHNQRKTKNHSNKEIDTDLSDLNYDLVNQTENYKIDIEKFINENKSTSRAVRKDAVLVNEWIISSDEDFFNYLEVSEVETFFESAKDYFAQKFGEENIRYATVHLDESTPHMHMGIVPFDDENKLSAKRVFNRQALRDVQEELPKYLQELGFDIERGRKGSKRKNLTVPEFKEMKKEQREIKKELERNKNELSAYVKGRNLETPIDSFKIKRQMKNVEVPSGEKILNYEFTKTVKKPTGNLIISEKDFKKIEDMDLYVKKINGKLLNILDTDVYKENKELKKDLEMQKDKNNNDIDDYNKLAEKYNNLQEENRSLRSQMSDLKEEIKLIYQSIKKFLKDRITDSKDFKSLFKELADTISIKSKEKALNSNFKIEFDKENRKKKLKR